MTESDNKGEFQPIQIDAGNQKLFAFEDNEAKKDLLSPVQLHLLLSDSSS